MGIEALSRGADHCEFVERDRACAAVIRDNLAATGLQARARVHSMAVERTPERLEGPFSLVFADPPYDDDAAGAALELVARSALIGPGGTLVMEHSRRREAPAELGRLGLSWSRRYGDTRVSIYRG